MVTKTAQFLQHSILELPQVSQIDPGPTPFSKIGYMLPEQYTSYIFGLGDQGYLCDKSCMCVF